MKILSVFGSPRRQGNTNHLLDAFLEGVQKSHPTVQVERIGLFEQDIKPCTGCGACKSSPEAGCIIADDMQKWYPKILDADLIVLATPIYWFNMTAQMKTFIDRMYRFDFSKFPKGKKIALLMTFADPDYETSGAWIVVESVKMVANYLDMELVLDYGVCSAVPVKDNAEALSEAERLGGALLS